MANVPVRISRSIVQRDGATGSFPPPVADTDPVITDPLNPPGSGGGVGTFVELTDTPDNYVGEAGKIIAVKSDESGLEYVPNTAITTHNDLSGLQGGSATERYHLTKDQFDAVDGANNPDSGNVFATLADLGNAGFGTVTSVGLSAPDIFSVANSPITTAGTLAISLVNQSAFHVFARGSGSGVPSFQALVADHIPNLAISKITGLQSALDAKLGEGLLSARIFVGNSSGIAEGRILSLNATGGNFGLSNTGVLTFPNASASARGLLTSADWNTFNGKQNALGFTPENVANKSTSTSLGTSNTLYPSQNAVKVYVDNQIATREIAFSKGNIVQGTGLSLSGTLTDRLVNSGNVTFAVNFGTTAGTVAEGNDQRILNGDIAFGWGNHAGLYIPEANLISNLNTTSPPVGLSRFSSSGFQASNRPNTAVNYWSILDFRHRINEDFRTQLATGTTGATPELWLRNNTNGSWGTWRQVWHTGNLSNPITGSGTNNFVPKFTGSGTLSNSQIFDNGTNVGIGTISPSARLQVVSTDFNTLVLGTINADSNVRIHGQGTTSGGLIIDSNNLIAFRVGGSATFLGTERMRITSDGNVGIGTTSPLGSLDVRSQASGSQQVVFPLSVTIGKGGNSYGSIGYNLDYRDATNNTTNVKYLSTDTISQLVFEAGGFIFRNAPTDEAGNVAALTELMRITSGGNVLIGTTTPLTGGGRLQVNGAVNASQFYSEVITVTLPNNTSDTVNLKTFANTEVFIADVVGIFVDNIDALNGLGGTARMYKTWDGTNSFLSLGSQLPFGIVYPISGNTLRASANIQSAINRQIRVTIKYLNRL